jgi:HK97 gp10 family phage protein
MIGIDIKIEKDGSGLDAAVEKAIGQGLMALALMAQTAAQRSILKGPKTGRLYPRGKKMHRASADGEAPANDFGFLVANIKADLTNDFTANLWSLAPYSVYLEYGTYNMAARPFLRPAGESVRARAKEIIDAYVGAALK